MGNSNLISIESGSISGLSFNKSLPHSYENEFLISSISSALEDVRDSVKKFDQGPEMEFLTELPFDSLSLFRKNLTEHNSRITDFNEWVGYITQIDTEENFFTAKLFDKSDDSTFELAEFSFKDVSPEDFPFLKVGSVFYWFIGYVTSNGQVKKQSVIRFQRLANITELEFNKICDETDRFLSELIWD